MSSEQSCHAHFLSFIQCNHCGEILREPVNIPCGLIICERHLLADNTSGRRFPLEKCPLCGAAHTPPFARHVGSAAMIVELNRAAEAGANVRPKLERCAQLRSRPVEYIDECVEQVRGEVRAARDRCLARVEAEWREHSRRLDEFRAQCVAELTTTGDELETSNGLDESYVEARLAACERDLQPDSLSKRAWQRMLDEAARTVAALEKRVGELEAAIMRRRGLRFEAADEASLVFGRLVVVGDGGETETGNDARTITCVTQEMNPRNSKETAKAEPTESPNQHHHHSSHKPQRPTSLSLAVINSPSKRCRATHADSGTSLASFYDALEPTNDLHDSNSSKETANDEKHAQSDVTSDDDCREIDPAAPCTSKLPNRSSKTRLDDEQRQRETNSSTIRLPEKAKRPVVAVGEVRNAKRPQQRNVGGWGKSTKLRPVKLGSSLSTWASSYFGDEGEQPTRSSSEEE